MLNGLDFTKRLKKIIDFKKLKRLPFIKDDVLYEIKPDLNRLVVYKFKTNNSCSAVYEINQFKITVSLVHNFQNDSYFSLLDIYEDKIFKSGATFAFWIKLDGNDEIYVGPSQSNPGYQIKNPYKNRTIFSSDRTDYDIDDDASDISNCIHFGKSFAIRVINDQESQNHRKISIVSTHIRVGIKKQFE